MKRAANIAIKVLAFSLAACGPSRGPTAAVTAHNPRVKALIGELASKFPPLHADGDSMVTDAFMPRDPSPRTYDEDRVQRAMKDLTAMGVSAFPDLIENLSDRRFSQSTNYQAWENESVGDTCFGIIESQVDFYGTGYLTREGEDGQQHLKPQYLWDIRDEGGLMEWWGARKGRSLTELQVESLRWTISKENEIGFPTGTDMRLYLDPLEKRLGELLDVPSK